MGKKTRRTKFIVFALCALFLIGILPAGFSGGVSSIQTVQAATKVKLNKTKATLIKTQTLQLKITGTDSKVTWKSSKKSVASVDANGLVTAKKKGSATITATVDGKKYTCEIEVETPSISAKEIAMRTGSSWLLKINGTTQKVKWSSSDTSIATVTSKGAVKGKKTGTATVTAKIGEFEYICNVIIENPAFSKTIEEMLVGTEAKLVLKRVGTDTTWKSSNNKVVTVDSDGNIKAISNGNAIIKAKTKTSLCTCHINVFSFAETNIGTKEGLLSLQDFKVGDSVKLELYSPYGKFTNQGGVEYTKLENLESIQWSSSDENIATISEDGTLKILGNGIVRITATYNGESVNTNIRILDIDYINKNVTIKMDLNEVKKEPYRWYQYITVESNIKDSFPIKSGLGKILFYDNDQNVVAIAEHIDIELDKSGVNISYTTLITGNPETAISYEFICDGYSLREYSPLINITNDISVNSVWTTKNYEDHSYDLSRFLNEYMITCKNDSSYKMEKCFIKIKSYAANNTLISEETIEISDTYKNISIYTEKEVSRAEFEVVYAYALMED